MQPCTLKTRSLAGSGTQQRLNVLPRASRGLMVVRASGAPESTGASAPQPVTQSPAPATVQFDVPPPPPPPAVPLEVPYPVMPTATYQAGDPRMYQGAPVPGQQGQYYVGAPPPYYMQALPPVVQEKSESGFPWFVWFGAGAVVMQVITKVQGFMKNPKSPQQMMAEMAMKQMMGGMGGAPGAMPNLGGMPFPAAGKAGGPSPFGTAGGPSSFGNVGPSPFVAATSPAAAATSTVDVTPTATSEPAAAPGMASTTSSSGSSKKGDKFEARLAAEGREPTKAAEAPKLDVVEPVVKEPTSSSSSGSSSSTSSSRASSSFFTDVDAQPAQSSTQTGANNAGAGAAGGSSAMTDMMEQMLRNPELQKMIYPHLPEPMRNPQSIEWMLSNPEVKQQMEQMFAQQPGFMNPEMMAMLKGMDQDKVNKQFKELGLKPEDVVSKVMANPQLASAFANPKVQAAILDISANPMNITKYQSDPEVLKVLESINELFKGDIPPNMRS